ncbi:MAG: L,D-transpeptidase family protein [Spirosomataceae bacterium]
MTLMSISHAQSFLQTQLQYERVKASYEEKGNYIEDLLKEKRFEKKPFQIFIRAFKEEKSLELWIKSGKNAEFSLLKTYKIAASSGVLGPKRKEGDLQVPEGFYHIDRFNPLSSYYLSLGINYPNASDKKLSDKVKPGGDIFIHGSDVTVGCLPLTDELIKEVYLIAAMAKNYKQIEVHIFPFKMEKLDDYKSNPNLIFWQNLAPGYTFFEKNHKLPAIKVAKDGKYRW